MRACASSSSPSSGTQSLDVVGPVEVFDAAVASSRAATAPGL